MSDIGTHFAQALGDGRYDENKGWKYGRHESRRPTDSLPKGIKFGGQIPMDDDPEIPVTAYNNTNVKSNAEVSHGAKNL